MLKSLFNLGKDVAEIATAPVEIAAGLARTVTRPVADVAKETAGAVRELTQESQSTQLSTNDGARG